MKPNRQADFTTFKQVKTYTQPKDQNRTNRLLVRNIRTPTRTNRVLACNIRSLGCNNRVLGRDIPFLGCNNRVVGNNNRVLNITNFYRIEKENEPN